ncbi:uncharacterized protein LOC126834059 [Adelges cooleyi]|uniref:uncharacterized protein LOC126834059 n=1 Tax=Adelges cooleyi TaxID=133065 RepID=UPI00217F752E|nr:uncharacterized protein LOC126834059 [Adelges cooleyi]
MTKLQVFCFFAITICIVINNIKCASPDECRDQICKTNNKLSNLTDNQKYQLVNGLIRAYSYARIQVLIFPPVPELMASRGRAKAFDSIITQEQDILQFITDQELAIEYDLTDFNTAVYNRHQLIRTIFNHVLHHQMNNIQMCVNDEGKKCKLVGIITRALNPEHRFTQRCNEEFKCVIALEGMITADGVVPTYNTRVENYVDRRLPSGLYKTELEAVI